MINKASLTKSDIIKYIRDNKLFKNFAVRELKSGLANKNFLITIGNKQYNLRTNRLRPPMKKENLRNEHLILEFLGKKEIPFVSRSHYYDKEENIHIVKFIPGQKIQIKNLKKENLEIVLKYLYQINGKAEEFAGFLKKKKVKLPRARKYNNELARRAEPKIEWLKKDKLYSKHINWVEKRLLNDLGSLKIGEREIYLNHGDPVSNVIINVNKLYLIDWEQVCFSYDPGLANIFTHGFISDEMKEDIIKIYSKIAGYDTEWLRGQTIKKYKQMLLEHIILLCRIHARNRRLYKSPAPLDTEFIRDRQQKYLETKL